MKTEEEVKMKKWKDGQGYSCSRKWKNVIIWTYMRMSETGEDNYYMDVYEEEQKSEWRNEMADWTGNMFMKESALLLECLVEYVCGRPVGDKDWLSSQPE